MKEHFLRRPRGLRNDDTAKEKTKVIILIMALLIASSAIPVQAGDLKTGTYSFRKDYDAIELAAQSVFYVEVYDSNDQCYGSASGFIAFDEHLFVTNEHVIRDASYIKVWDENNKMYFISQLIAVDIDHDIAILLFPEGKQYAPLELNYSDDLKRGQPVLAIGSPKGYQGTVSIGNISAFPQIEKYVGVTCIQYTAPSSQGSSGGCLFDDNGKVIGITSAISREGQNINIAVPVRYLKNLYDSWNKRDYRILDSNYNQNADSSAISYGVNKDKFAAITGGKIEAFVAIPLDADLYEYFYPMEYMTVAQFLVEYENVRINIINDAPAIKDRKLIMSSSLLNQYFLQIDREIGVGSRIFCNVEGMLTLDVPINKIIIISENETNATARACIAVFADDPNLIDKMVKHYNDNDYFSKELYVSYLTKDGYLFLYTKNTIGAGVLQIMYVVSY